MYSSTTHQINGYLKMAVFWVVAPCSLVEVYQRFRGPCCLRHQRDGGNKDLWNVGKLLPDYTALQPRRKPSSYSSPWEPQILNGYLFHIFLLVQDRVHWQAFVNMVINVIFHVLTVASMKKTVFWVVAPCGMVDTDWCFRWAYCLEHQGDDDRGTKHLWNIGKLLPDYTLLHPRRQSSVMNLRII
jgi:hypothetical protein